jgi:endonuclease/exonuclease/phosphatase family metal-dependent hydrolase
MRLGHGQQKDYSALGDIVRRGSFDFLALQEAMTDEGVETFRVSIEAATGERWVSMSSHAIGRASYKEMYAFLWNAEVLEYVDGAVVYLDATDRFAREPYSARFRVRGSELMFVAATVHILHGDTVSDRTPEIEALAEYWSWLREVYPDDADRILLMGDFNLAPHRPEWAALRTVAEPLVVSGATTLSSTEGRFANLYDNVWVPIRRDPSIVASGILEFPAVLGLTHEEARRHVSDHAPVWLRLKPSTQLVPATVTMR